MNKITLFLLSTLLTCVGMNAQEAKKISGLRHSSLPTAFADVRNSDGIKSRKNVRKAASRPQKVSPAPGRFELIEPADNDEEIYVKSGFSYVYSSFFGISTQSCDGAISNVVYSEDGKKIYVQTPFFLDYYTEESWIEGDVEDGIVTFTFPQLVDEDIDEEEPEYDVYGYCMKVHFKIEDEQEQTGWYYPTESQEYKFKIEADGTLSSLEDEDTMMGYCYWIEPEDDSQEGHFSWQGTGDIVFSLTPNKAEEAEVPSDLEYETWKCINGISYTNVSIAVKDDYMYIKGLFNKTGMKNKVVIGKIDGDQVTFNNAQYLGVYQTNYTLAYFLTGEMEDEMFVVKDKITFNWDREKKRLTTDGAICISQSPETIVWYMLSDKPAFAIPMDNIVVNKLYTPVLTSFYDVDDEYDYDAELSFNLPTVDPDYQILDTSNIYYQVILNGEIFTFYDDEYELPNDESETTMIPYGYYNNAGDIDAWGTEHTLELHVRGFETFGVREVYKNEDGSLIYSDILYAPGYTPKEDSGIANMGEEKNIVGVKYFDLNGKPSAHPEKGIYVKQVLYTDGSFKTYKMYKK